MNRKLIELDEDRRCNMFECDHMIQYIINNRDIYFNNTKFLVHITILMRNIRYCYDPKKMKMLEKDLDIFQEQFYSKIYCEEPMDLKTYALFTNSLLGKTFVEETGGDMEKFEENLEKMHIDYDTRNKKLQKIKNSMKDIYKKMKFIYDEEETIFNEEMNTLKGFHERIREKYIKMR